MRIDLLDQLIQFQLLLSDPLGLFLMALLDRSVPLNRFQSGLLGLSDRLNQLVLLGHLMVLLGQLVLGYLSDLFYQRVHLYLLFR